MLTLDLFFTEKAKRSQIDKDEQRLIKIEGEARDDKELRLVFFISAFKYFILIFLCRYVRLFFFRLFE
jgi:hypothetical protein